MVSTALTWVWGFEHCHQYFVNPMITDVRKAKLSHTILCAVPTEIHSYSEISPTVTLLSEHKWVH